MAHKYFYYKQFWRHWSLHDLNFLWNNFLINVTCFTSNVTCCTCWHLYIFSPTMELLRKAVKQPLCCITLRIVINKWFLNACFKRNPVYLDLGLYVSLNNTVSIEYQITFLKATQIDISLISISKTFYNCNIFHQHKND